MHSIAVANKTLILPALVPSVSSFETQLRPIPALQLQQTLREPISLVSAYDIKNGREELINLCREYQRSAVLLLDSGGYEYSRIKRYAGEKAPPWTFEDFKTVCDLNLHDFVFSYDYFWRDPPHQSESADDFELRLVGEIFQDHTFVCAEQLIPVLHLQTRNGEERLSEADTLKLVARLASECRSPFIAIPERELGDGLLERFEFAKKICAKLAESNSKVFLHVLGCGNPLSFAFMCVAGAKMADGLEWCRTFAADNFHLHHFQQEPVFASQNGGIYNPTADLLLSMDVPYPIKVATRNLISLQNFMADVTHRLSTRTVYELVATEFGDRAGSALRANEA